MLAPSIGLIDAWYPNFGDCLFAAIAQLLDRGHAAAVVLNSDSPTLPTALLVETAERAGAPGRSRRARPVARRRLLSARPQGAASPPVRGRRLEHRAGRARRRWIARRRSASTSTCCPNGTTSMTPASLRMLRAELDEVVARSRGLRRHRGRSIPARAAPRPARLADRPAACRIGHDDPTRRCRGPPNDDKRTARRIRSAISKGRASRGEPPSTHPVCVYLETTNRCNLLCTTCPRTYEELEPPADMSWELFRSIVDQLPNIERAVLHGVGEPMLVKALPRMVRYLKDRGTYVLFNTNGTVLNEKNGRALIDAGLDELRVSLDAANAQSYLAVRGKNYFNRILKNVRAFRELQEREGKDRPRVSAWLTGLKETIGELPAFVRVAAEIGVKEVYLQRLVFFERDAIGHARPDQALYEQMTREEAEQFEEATALARRYGITFSASGAVSEPGMSLKRQNSSSPWSMCRRPWTVMYFTANGRALPCCIAPFSQRGYENYTLGDATQQTLQDIWNGPAYRSFREGLLSDHPPAACASCGLRWSL